MIDTSLVFNSISAICLIIATVFTYRNFTLIKTMENENHYFKEKIENYQNIISILYELTDNIQFILHKFNIDNDFTGEKFEKEYIEFSNKFRKSLTQNLLLLPDDIFKKIEDFYDYIFIEEYEKEVELTDDEQEKFINECLEKVEKIAYEMRNDLNVNPINHKLKKRTLS